MPITPAEVPPGQAMTHRRLSKERSTSVRSNQSSTSLSSRLSAEQKGTLVVIGHIASGDREDWNDDFSVEKFSDSRRPSISETKPLAPALSVRQEEKLLTPFASEVPSSSIDGHAQEQGTKAVNRFPTASRASVGDRKSSVCSLYYDCEDGIGDNTSEPSSLPLPMRPKVESEARNVEGAGNLEPEEDWDQELGLSAGETDVRSAEFTSLINGFRNIVKIPQHQTEDQERRCSDTAQQIPYRCCLMEQVTKKQQLKILKYPKPLVPFKLKHEDGYILRSEKMLEDWLKQSVSSKSAAYLAAERATVKEDLDLLEATKNKNAFLSKIHVRAYLDCCWSVHRKEKRAACWKMIVRFFEKLEGKRKIIRKKLSSPASHSSELSNSDAGWKSTKASQSSIDHFELPPDIAGPDVSNLVLQLLTLGILVLSPNHEGGLNTSTTKTKSKLRKRLKSFGKMLQTTAAAFPSQAVQVSLSELRAVAHHLGDLTRWKVPYKWRAQFHLCPGALPGLKPALSFTSAPAELPKHLLRSYAQCLVSSRLRREHHQEKQKLSPSSTGPSSPLENGTIRCSGGTLSGRDEEAIEAEQLRLLFLIVSCLSDLQLCLSGLSPITCTETESLRNLAQELGDEDEHRTAKNQSLGDDEDEDWGEQEMSKPGEGDDDLDSLDWSDLEEANEFERAIRWQEDEGESSPCQLSGNEAVGISYTSPSAAVENYQILSVSSFHNSGHRGSGMSRSSSSRPSHCLPRDLRMEEDSIYDLLHSGSFRVQLLLDFYSLLRPLSAGRLMMKAAFVLAKFGLMRVGGGGCERRRDGDERVASERGEEESLSSLCEQLLYECVLLMDQTEPIPSSNVPCFTSFGVQALESFGDILIRNQKYKYAILAYEAAITAHKIKEKRDYDKLNRRLCGITLQHRDLQRSLSYHLKVLQSSRMERNINEFVFVSEVLSKIQLEQGMFTAAESNLQVALMFLNEASAEVSSPTLADSYQAHRLDLQMKIVEVQIARDHLDQATKTLQGMAEGLPACARRSNLFFLLLKCFLRMRQLDDCNRMFSALEAEALAYQLNQEGKKGDSYNFDGYRSHEIVQSYQFRSYKARAFLYALRLEEGVSSISSYLSLSPPISHPVLGKLWYLQGKIYEEKYDQLANRRRESKQRRPRKATEDSLDGQTGTPDLQQLMTQKEVACQALECYKKAVSYFSAVEDVQNQAKSSARLSSFMLKRIFESGREQGDSTELLKDCAAYTLTSLERCGETASPLIMAHCLVNLSELRYLQDRIDLALSAWKEAYRLISSLYLQKRSFAVMKGEREGEGITEAAGNGSLPLAPFGPGVLMKLESLVRRLVRLSFLLNPPQLLSKELPVAHLMSSLVYLEVLRYHLENSQRYKEEQDRLMKLAMRRKDPDASMKEATVLDNREIADPALSKVPFAPPVDAVVTDLEKKRKRSSYSDFQSLVQQMQGRDKVSVKVESPSSVPSHLAGEQIADTEEKLLSGLLREEPSAFAPALPLTKYQGMSSMTSSEALWSCFYRLHNLNPRKYQTGEMSLNDFRSENIRIMQEILRLKREVEGPEHNGCWLEEEEKGNAEDADADSGGPLVFMQEKSLNGSNKTRHSDGASQTSGRSRTSKRIGCQESGCSQLLYLSSVNGIFYSFRPSTSEYCVWEEWTRDNLEERAQGRSRQGPFRALLDGARPHDKDLVLTVLTDLLGEEAMLMVFSSLLLERSVLIVGNVEKQGLITGAVDCLLRLIRPLHWKGLCIPLLPPSCSSLLMDLCLRPGNAEPFIMGTFDVVLQRCQRQFVLEELENVRKDDGRDCKGWQDVSSVLKASNLPSTIVVDLSQAKVTIGTDGADGAAAESSLLPKNVLDKIYVSLFQDQHGNARTGSSLSRWFSKHLRGGRNGEQRPRPEKNPSTSLMAQPNRRQDSSGFDRGGRLSSALGQFLVSLLKRYPVYYKEISESEEAASGIKRSRLVFDAEGFCKGGDASLVDFLSKLVTAEHFRSLVNPLSQPHSQSALAASGPLTSFMAGWREDAARRMTQKVLKYRRLRSLTLSGYLLVTLGDASETQEGLTERKEEKRRWCTLTSTEIIVYRWRSKTNEKGRLHLSPSSTSLVLVPSPFLLGCDRKGGRQVHLRLQKSVDVKKEEMIEISTPNVIRPEATVSQLTHLAFRCESEDQWREWTSAIKARLLQQDIWERMQHLYGEEGDGSRSSER